MRNFIRFMTVIVLLTTASMVWAQKPIAYPSKGQDAQQQTTDDAQCLGWSKQQTGIDPAAIAAAPAPSTGPQGERVRGALRGAAGGAVIGEIVDDDAGKGAGVGAAAGVLAGGARARRNHAAQAQQAQASKSQALATYYEAYGACMQGRGYSVK
ncbi:YmgG-like glycine-zipper protein [Luteimonas cucumeris]|uniref:YmgG-like glycine-zipper protein n=1 Tax=Luteimonas cucumeris TaxID=985012 RepID=A0A562L7C4_9GAMM|nr:YMGG-like glycine zipper-containing protein [Luteimonas cucumeris]TWI03550.1 YmgG-like glycine-zipper protein [Luteimonas cucumeris]